MKKIVYVLYGGKSAEHQVSVDSAQNVLNELNKEFYDVFAVYITQEGLWCEPIKVDSHEKLQRHQLIREAHCDLRSSIANFLTKVTTENSIVFPVLHGTYGEDGTLQGMLEMLNIPYVGNGVCTSAVGMDKIMSKKVFSDHNIPQTPFVYFNRDDFKQRDNYYVNLIQTMIGFPCYVKPANMGSSIGISRCLNQMELRQAISTAFSFDHKILIEKEVVGKEVIIGMTGNETLHCSLAGEWQREQKFFDYEDKYLDDDLTPQIPALISEETYQAICAYGKEAYNALDGTGLMRLDFFVTESEEIYLNEVNTLPGFTKHSMFPVLFEKTENLSYTQLLDRLITLGFNVHEQKRKLEFRRVEV